MGNTHTDSQELLALRLQYSPNDWTTVAELRATIRANTMVRNAAANIAFNQIQRQYSDTTRREQSNRILECLRIATSADALTDSQFVAVPPVHPTLDSLEWHCDGARGAAARIAQSKPRSAAGKMLHAAADTNFCRRHDLIQHAAREKLGTVANVESDCL